MALEILTATHDHEGIWDFVCPMHKPLPFSGRGISAPRQAMAALKKHMDDAHPGATARLKVISQFSGTKTTTYTAPSNVPTRGIL